MSLVSQFSLDFFLLFSQCLTKSNSLGGGRTVRPALVVCGGLLAIGALDVRDLVAGVRGVGGCGVEGEECIFGLVGWTRGLGWEALN